MAIDIGKKVKVITINNEVTIGFLTGVLIGADSKNPTKTSIIIEDKENDVQEMIWTDSLVSIKELN